jgi:hypothetical protein
MLLQGALRNYETTTMKKPQKTNSSRRMALFAGAAAFMTLTPRIQAQTSVDALLNKLEQKGVLTVDEARELKTENATNSIADINSAMNSRFPIPDWVTSYKLSGDFRGRFDDVSTDTPFTAGHDNNIRLRYRLRAGLAINMQDGLQVGFRLGTDDAASGNNMTGGNPLGNNTTLNGNGSKKFIFVDAAYGKWTAINDGTWMVAATIGKMDQPFQASYMLFDPDYTPEGGALQTTYNINDRNSLTFNGAAFVLAQANTRGPFLYGGQTIWTNHWTSKIVTTAGIAAYDIADGANLGTFAGAPPGPTPPYDTNLGNTINGTRFASDYNPIVASGSITYTLDSFPLYPGVFPIRLAGEYMNNPAAGSNNDGWNAGVTLGKSGKKGAWDVSYRYQWLEADAWWDQVVDDDNVALFPASATFGNTGAAAAVGGTNIKGHLVKFNYSIFDSLTFTFTCYINDLIINPVPGTKTDAVHAMADLMWKF